MSAATLQAERDLSPFGADTQHYWDQRYDFFSRFDEGIRVDREGLYSVKPERIAFETAKRLNGEVVFDAFCGVGGSAIGFARQGKHVITADTSAERLAMARHNAGIYGVAGRIEFVHGDAPAVMRSAKFDCASFDPAWGGPDYVKLERFTFANFVPDGNLLAELALGRNVPFAFSLPKNFDFNELARLHRPFELTWEKLNGKLLFATVIFKGDVNAAPFD